MARWLAAMFQNLSVATEHRMLRQIFQIVSVDGDHAIITPDSGAATTNFWQRFFWNSGLNACSAFQLSLILIHSSS